MNHAAFAQAIRDAPTDPTPRLVFADWLDDRGEANRAELIRSAHAVRQGDSSLAARVGVLLEGVYTLPPAEAAGRLIEAGYDLPAVLRLFAGTPPDFIFGCPQDVLVHFCRETEPEKRIAALPYSEEALIVRWQAVRRCRQYPHGLFAKNRTVLDLKIVQSWRYLKRSVLDLFRDVIYHLQHDFSYREIDAVPSTVNATLRSLGFRLDLLRRPEWANGRRVVRYQQTLTANDLIPPEPTR